MSVISLAWTVTDDGKKKKRRKIKDMMVLFLLTPFIPG